MKKFFSFALFFLLFMNLLSCSKSKEDKINAAFKDYVQNNFDDPSQFVEVVSIETKDTFSTINYKKVYRDLCERVDTLNKISNQQKLEIDSFMEKYGGRLFSISGFDETFQEMIDANKQYTNYMEQYVLPSIYRGETTDMLVADEFDNLRDTIFLISDVKYRVKRSGELMLETIKCFCDTCHNHFFFGNQEISDDDYLKVFYELFSKNSDYMKKQIELKTELVNKMNNLIMLVRENI